MKFRSIALGVAACFVASSALSQPVSIQNRLSHSSHGGTYVNIDNDKEKGRKCFYGTCGSCSANCSTKTSTVACYNCCSANGCDGNNDSGWCQDYCDGTNSPWSGWGDLTDADRDGYMEAAVQVIGDSSAHLIGGNAFTQTEIEWHEGLLARLISKGDVAKSRVVLAIVLEAYALDQIVVDDQDRLDRMIGELHHTALFHMGDSKVRSTARKIAADHGILGARDRGHDFVLVVNQLAAEGADADSNLFKMFMNR